MRMSLVWTATWDYVIVQGLGKDSPGPHWLWHLGGPVPSLGSRVELALMAGVYVDEMAQGCECRRACLVPYLLYSGVGVGEMPFSLRPLATCGRQDRS